MPRLRDESNASYSKCSCQTLSVLVMFSKSEPCSCSETHNFEIDVKLYQPLIRLVSMFFVSNL